MDAKIKLLDFYLREHSITVSDDINTYIVEHIDSDVRRIISIVKTILTYKDIYNKDIDMAFCKKYLKILNPITQPGELTPEKILTSVSQISKVSINDLKSHKRTKTVAYYRQLLMYVLRRYTKLSLPEIGNYLGGKTNATVHFGISQIEKLIKKEPDTLQTVQKIIKNC
jgi:chromosomal replication initiator protein